MPAVLIINTRPAAREYIRSRFASYPESRGYRTLVIHACENEWPRNLKTYLDENDVRGIVIGGSPAAVYSHETWVRNLILKTQELTSYDVPILGVCLGYQVLANLAGVRFEPRADCAHRGIERVRVVTPGRHILFWGLEPEFDIIVCFEDHFRGVPTDAELLALGRDECHPFAHRFFGKPIYGVQGHPELDSEYPQYSGPFRQSFRGNLEDLDWVSGRRIYMNFIDLLSRV